MSLFQNHAPAPPLSPDFIDNPLFTQYGLSSATLDQFVPGFNTVRKFLIKRAGIDITRVAAYALLVWTLTNSGKYMWDKGIEIFWRTSSYFMTQVNIQSTEPLYRELNAWLATKVTQSNTRILTASTIRNDQMNDIMGAFANMFGGQIRFSGAHGQGGSPKKGMTPLQPLSKGGRQYSWANDVEETRNRVLLKPGGKSRTWFRHEGAWFFLRVKESRDSKSGRVATSTLNLSCLGWSSAPLQKLLEEASTFSRVEEEPKTAVFIVRQGVWDISAERPARPLSTVDMDSKDKQDMVDDITKYLASRQFYSNRGIPYRRGYLLYGPPGTGKTSLSSAIAGEYKLELYCMSLSTSGMSDAMLEHLFMDLPERCVVLMEDIDAVAVSQQRAGIRDGDEEAEEDEEDWAKKQQRQQQMPQSMFGNSTHFAQQMRPEAPQLTLSGLLNVIDGVASAEGRILIMTTNHRENLDKALVRPGRIDRQIYMGHVSREVARAIFLRMYTQSPEEAKTSAARINKVEQLGRTQRRASGIIDMVDNTAKGSPAFGPSRGRAGTLATPASPISPFMLRRDTGISSVKDDAQAVTSLEAYAITFSKKIPEQTFSPAEVQGYLLKHREDPLQALTSCDAWVEELLKRKQKKSKPVKLEKAPASKAREQEQERESSRRPRPRPARPEDTSRQRAHVASHGKSVQMPQRAHTVAATTANGGKLNGQQIAQIMSQAQAYGQAKAQIEGYVKTRVQQEQPGAPPVADEAEEVSSKQKEENAPTAISMEQVVEHSEGGEIKQSEVQQPRESPLEGRSKQASEGEENDVWDDIPDTSEIGEREQQLNEPAAEDHPGAETQERLGTPRPDEQ